MRYLNAAETARALGIGDKTIRRWLKAGRFPSAIMKANGEYAIPESDVEELKQHRIKYVHAKSTSHDQSDVSALAEKVATLEQEVAELRKAQSLPSQKGNKPPIEEKPISTKVEPLPSQKTIVEPKRSYERRKDTGLPAGAIPATEFGLRHNVKRETFRDHMMTGLGPGLIHGPGVLEDGSMLVKDYVKSEERNKRVRKDGTIEKERYLTQQQQAAALEFWKRHDVAFTECDQADCLCHKGE